MTRVQLILAIILLSCRQPNKGNEIKNPDKIITVDRVPNRGTIYITDSTQYNLVDSKASLDSLFLRKRDSSKFVSQNIWTSLIIGNLFNKNKKSAVLRYMENDTASTIIVLQQSKHFWDTIFSTRVYPVHTGALEDVIQLADFNGDNVPDLKLVKDHWDIHPGNLADLWLHQRGQFKKVKGFDEIVSAEYDKKTNLIYSYQSTGCADMSMYFGVFKIVDDKVQKVKEMECDCCVEKNDSCTIKVVGQKPFWVPYKTAYKHVPAFFADGVKQKCEG